MIHDVLVWALWNKTADRRVDLTTFPWQPEEIRVSTVFLGIDHRFSDEGLPILWETMVFNGPLDHEMDRYRSRDDAIYGHQKMCQHVREVLELAQMMKEGS